MSGTSNDHGEARDVAAIAQRYFDLAISPDRDAYFAQFAPDAVAEDDGNVHRGIDEIRAWRTDVPDVTYAVREVRPTAEGLVAGAEIAGDFPGSPVALVFELELDGDLIKVLRIHP